MGPVTSGWALGHHMPAAGAAPGQALLHMQDAHRCSACVNLMEPCLDPHAGTEAVAAVSVQNIVHAELGGTHHLDTVAAPAKPGCVLPVRACQVQVR